jgi:hypothetical protein
MTMNDGKQMYKCHSCLKESPVESSPSPEARVDWEKEAHKGVTEWKIDEHLTLYPILSRGIDAKSIPYLVKSVTKALSAAYEAGEKKGRGK